MNASLTKTIETKINQYVFPNRKQSRKIAHLNFHKVIQNYPQWKASLFDEYFFTAKMIPMIETARKKGSRVNSQQVTLAWANQFKLSSSFRQKLMRELAPIVDQIIGDLV